MTEEQEALCAKYGAAASRISPRQTVGFARDFDPLVQPCNGVRYPPEGDATGWYLWTGPELSDDRDYFLPVRVEHLEELCPEVVKYLGLPPGWRFLFAEKYEDVWRDEDIPTGAGHG
ncbi:MAG: hypothetical protein U1E50_10330 [Caulobacteraceae bacterium]